MNNTLPPKILILEHPNINNIILCNTIERKCFNVIRSLDYKVVLRNINNLMPNIIAISSRIDGISALEFAVRLRKISVIPIIFIVDVGESIDNYKSLDNDLVECISRPVDTNKFLYIMKLLLRKSKPVLSSTVLSYKGLSMNLSNYGVVYNNNKISLGPIEFRILQLFVRNPGVAHTRQDIIKYILNNQVDREISIRTIDVHVNRIRKLIKNKNDNKSIIRTIRSVGYCLL